MKLKPTIAVAFCIMCLPSLASAGLFDKLKEQLEKKIVEAKEEIAEVKE